MISRASSSKRQNSQHNRHITRKNAREKPLIVQHTLSIQRMPRPKSLRNKRLLCRCPLRCPLNNEATHISILSLPTTTPAPIWSSQHITSSEQHCRNPDATSSIETNCINLMVNRSSCLHLTWIRHMCLICRAQNQQRIICIRRCMKHYGWHQMIGLCLSTGTRITCSILGSNGSSIFPKSPTMIRQ